MTPVLIFIIVFLAAAVAGLVVFAWREAQKHGTNTREEFVGICASAVETTLQKEARKQKILTLLREQVELSNSEIRKVLKVSSRSVVRYMDELEAEGKVKQVGIVGHAVTYRPK